MSAVLPVLEGRCRHARPLVCGTTVGVRGKIRLESNGGDVGDARPPQPVLEERLCEVLAEGRTPVGPHTAPV